MTRFLHDRFAKLFLSDLLDPLGIVEPNRKVTDETQEIDLFFTPTSPEEDPNLGILGKMVSRPCLLEPFRNPVTRLDVRTCMSKQVVLHLELLRQAKSDKPEIPFLWILTPTASEELLKDFGAEILTDWQGVYTLAPFLKPALVVIHQLPRNRDTLWIRLLGRGRVQKQAVADILDLPEQGIRETVLRTLSNCRIVVNMKQETLEQEEKELIMNLSPAFLEWEKASRDQGKVEGKLEGIQEGIQKGIQEGIQKGKIEGKREQTLTLTKKILSRRLGSKALPLEPKVTDLSLEKLEELIEMLMDPTTDSELTLWLGDKI